MCWRPPLGWLVLPLTALLPSSADAREVAQDDQAPVWRSAPIAQAAAESGKPATLSDDGWVVLGDVVEETLTLEASTTLARLTALKLEVGTLSGRGKLEPGQPTPTFAVDSFQVSVAPPGLEHGEVPVRDAAVDAGPVHDARFLIDGDRGSWATCALGPAATTASIGLLLKDEFRTDSTKHTPITMNLRCSVRLQTRGLAEAPPDMRVRLVATGHTDPMGQLGGARVDAGMQGTINRAIDGGVDYLLAQQEIDGSWATHQPQYPAGGTALVVYTLIKCGLPKNHDAITRGVGYLRHHDTDRTYGVSTSILALVALDDRENKAWVQDLVDKLLETQNGGWAYPDGPRDMSTTQYAVLALRAAANWGIKIKSRVWLDVLEFAMRHQAKAGAYEGAGFMYREDHSHPVTGSMTASGVGVLAICREQLGSRFKAPAGNALNAGLLWLSEHFDPRGNPVPQNGEGALGGWGNYYYYGCERVGSLLELERFGKLDWYRMGAAVLIKRQDSEGKWTSQEKTSFTLLFLSRATGATSGPGQSSTRTYGEDDPDHAVSLRASGGSPLNMWVSSYGTESLEELEHPGESGKGPRVVRVEYHARRDSGGDWELLGQVDGDPAAAAGRARFALRHHFKLPGAYRIKASVVAQRPMTDEETTLESEELLVRVPVAFHAKLAGYAEDPGGNVIPRAGTKVWTSSERDDNYAGRYTLDRTQTNSWISQNEDPLPRITFEFKKVVKANTIVFSHVFQASNPGTIGGAKPGVVEVRLNNKREPFRIELDPDVYHKTEFAFPKNVTIKVLEVQVVELREGSPTDQGVGFAEIELRRVKR